MKRLILTLILICSFALAFAICAGASSYGVYDEIGALSYSEEAEIEEALQSASNKTGLSFYVGLVAENSLFSSSFQKRHYLYDTNMVLLLVDDVDLYTAGYCYTLHLFGEATERISENEEDSILDNLKVKELKKEDGSGLVSGICQFAKLAAKKAGGTGINWEATILCTVVSVLGGSGLFLLIVISRYRKKKRGTSYPFDQFTKLELTDQSDSFVTKTVTRYRYRSSSSSGSRSGGSRSRSSSRR